MDERQKEITKRTIKEYCKGNNITSLEEFAFDFINSWASDFIKMNVLIYLLDRGMSPNIQNKEGDTLLHLVNLRKVSNTDAFIKALIHFGADENIKNNDGFTYKGYKNQTTIAKSVFNKDFDVYHKQIIQDTSKIWNIGFDGNVK